MAYLTIMNKLPLFFFFLFLVFGHKAICQEHRASRCTDLINSLPYFRQSDSLINNDVTLFKGNHLLYCQQDSISMNFIIEKLGEPHKTINYDHLDGISIQYLYYDVKEVFGQRSYDRVSFFIDRETKLLKSIDRNIGQLWLINKLGDK
jgi:hypothetical protein